MRNELIISVYIAEKYIEGTPQVATAPVHRDEGKGELIEGMGTEDASLSEGTVTYDVRFRAVHPVSNEMVRMIINVEGQNDFYPGYPLVNYQHLGMYESAHVQAEYDQSVYHHVIAAIVGAIVYKEKITVKSAVGVVLGVLAVVCIKGLSV